MLLSISAPFAQPCNREFTGMENCPPRFAPSLSSKQFALAAGLALLCLWSYWPTLSAMAQRWGHDPQYSHGYLVPVFALALLWQRQKRGHASFSSPQMSVEGGEREDGGKRCMSPFLPSWSGLPLLAVAFALRLLADCIYNEWLEGASFVVAVAGLFGIWGGQAALRWSWPAVAFLLFMVPLPYTVQVALAFPLQTIGTHVSTYVLQTLGFPAVAQGHTIIFGDVRLGVAEACSGLSMMMIFVALSTAVALLVKRPLLDRLVIVGSAIPVALIANITRITVTGLMHVWAGRELADLVFHDLAGWLMMPFALGILWLELRLLRGLFVEQAPQGPMPLLQPLATSR
jgi:exosortase